ncbi:hypothetical protein [Paenibacillus polymyxa]|uniref:Uncharacterized protein n=1 Tax=Paenibacillus polymyxa (strain SC2) TaxID=886882 RepID=E3EJP6_PAEPS|nr:hypothetical protein [Paenibacillus polymyxa]ADO59644.1 hypothetical protein PPSC2_26920 [Paenibacillus polymyxa SC2]WPQ59531.1 hypothetical protein SKN87_28115 [Paenibacillus polymyxa]
MFIKKSKVPFKSNPLAMVRVALVQHVEEKVQGKFYKAKELACYQFLKNMKDETLEEILLVYIEREGLSEITLEDWRKEAKLMFDVIYDREDYKGLEIKYKRQGFGTTGLGVYDKNADVFYDCAEVEHWSKIREIVEHKYTPMFKALDQLYFNPSLNEYDGYTREEVESFIMDNFELVGESKRLDDYL